MSWADNLTVGLLQRLSQLRDESGQTLVEYALIIMFIAIALVLSLQLLAGGLVDTYEMIAGTIPGGS